MALLHPDVAVVLRHAGLRVQEGHADAALRTQAGIVAAAVLYGLPVELVAEPGGTDRAVREGGRWGGVGGVVDLKTGGGGGDGAQLRSDATHSSQCTRAPPSRPTPLDLLPDSARSSLCLNLLVDAAPPANDPPRVYSFIYLFLKDAGKLTAA